MADGSVRINQRQIAWQIVTRKIRDTSICQSITSYITITWSGRETNTRAIWFDVTSHVNRGKVRNQRRFSCSLSYPTLRTTHPRSKGKHRDG